MPVPTHGEASTAVNLHRIGVVADSDPGAIGAWKVWIEVDGSDNYVATWERDADDGGWHQLASASGATPTGAAGGSLGGTYPNPSIASSVSLPGSPTTTTQSPADNSTKVATTAYVDTGLALKASLAGATFSGDIVVPDEAYDATTWNGSTNVPTKNAVRDKIEAVIAAAGGGDALTSNPLSQFAATTSAQLRGVLSDETGTGAAVFADSPTLVNPVVGTQSPGDNSTKGASTAFVTAAVAAGAIDTQQAAYAAQFFGG